MTDSAQNKLLQHWHTRSRGIKVMAMTHEELVQEINQLPRDKRKALAEAILESVGEEYGGPRHGHGPEVTHADRLAAFHRLRGMLKTQGQPPTDEELKEDYVNYLTEKYS